MIGCDLDMMECVNEIGQASSSLDPLSNDREINISMVETIQLRILSTYVSILNGIEIDEEYILDFCQPT